MTPASSRGSLDLSCSWCARKRRFQFASCSLTSPVSTSMISCRACLATTGRMPAASTPSQRTSIVSSDWKILIVRYEDALDKAVHTLQDDFPVVRGGDMVGVISKQKILDALKVDGNSYVQSAMNRIFEVAARQESLASAFRKLTANRLSIIPVVDEQRLVGIVTLQNLMHSMALLAESRKLRKEPQD